MAVLSLTDLGGYHCFEQENCVRAGRDLASTYQMNSPYPHVVLDDFLDADVLQRVIEQFPDSTGHPCFDRNQERLKFQFRPDQCEGAAVRMLFAELNSRAFLCFLSEMTGISGLIADPYFAGAGLHETKRGGHLGIHADFPNHAELNLERRLNLLIYLNRDWEPDYGGGLELWDKGLARAEQTIMPLFGRAVIFNTASDTFHGHPEPLACPETRSRRSIATYYYTARAPALAPLQRTTDFRARPGSRDKSDWRIRLHNLKADWLPPLLQRHWHG